jgi:cell division protein FtsQ
MKKTLNISAWVLFLTGIFLIFSFSENKKNETLCSKVNIVIDEVNGNVFVTNEMIKTLINNSGYIEGTTLMEEVNASYIENKLLDITSVEYVSVFKEGNGVLKVKLKQRVPVFRVFNKNGTSFYVDDKGMIMPTSQNYTARIIGINGEINEKSVFSVNEIKQNDSLAQISYLDELFDFVTYFSKDEFLLAQFEQLYREKNGDIIVIPKVGNQKINFGNLNDFQTKIKKLKTFYKEGINPDNLNLYTEINLKYNGQIVCTKK